MRQRDNNGRVTRQSSESEELYRLIAEHSTDMISKHTPEGIYTYASTACRALLGYESEDLIGYSVYDFFHPEDLDAIKKTHSTILEIPDIGKVEYRIRRKDGTYIWFETTSKAIRNAETDKVLEIIAISRDISERKRTEEELLYRIKLIEAITENAADALFLLNPEARITFTNPAAARIFGWSIEELVGENLHDKLHHHRPDGRSYPIYECPLVGVLASGQTLHDHEDVFFRRDGTPVEVAYSNAPIIINEEITGAVVVVRHITERKQAEKQIYFQAHLLDQVQAAVIATDLNGIVTHWNTHAERLYGFSREEVLGCNISELTVGPTEAGIANEIMERLRRGESWEGEFTVQCKDGSTFTAYVVDSLIYDAQGRAVGVVGVSTDITERKRSEEDLRRSNRRVVNILESITDAFFAVDGEWRFTYVNGQAEQLLERSRDELLGKNMWEEFPEAVGSTFYEKYHVAVSSGRATHFEGFYPPLNQCVEVWAYPSSEGLTVYFQDITERKQVEEELRESEERFRATFEQAAVGVAHNALDGRWLRVNERLCKILGYSREELLQKTFQDITHPDDVEPNLNYLRRLLSRDLDSFSMEKRYIRKDASIVWGELTVSLVRKPSGEPDYLISVVEDISERKRAEEELRFRRVLLEAQTETSVDGILVVSSGGEMLSYNQRFVEMWSMPEEVLTTRSDEAALEVAKGKATDPQGFMARVNYLYEHPGEESHEEIQLKDGRTFDRYSAPVTGTDGTHYGRVWYFRDITRRKRAEQALLEIREAERRRIARDLHDAVLQDLSGTLQGLQAVQVEFDSTYRKANLRRETKALRRAVRGLRDAVHDLRHEKEPSFVKAVESLVEYNRQETPERQLRLNIQEDFPEELTEKVKVELLRTVQEALTNARRHSEARWTGVRLRNSQDGICIEVIDDGRGFDPESVRKGLGLLGMRERIASIGGKLTVHSDIGKGTTVCVTVPAYVLPGEEMNRKGPLE